MGPTEPNDSQDAMVQAWESIWLQRQEGHAEQSERRDIHPCAVDAASGNGGDQNPEGKAPGDTDNNGTADKARPDTQVSAAYGPWKQGVSTQDSIRQGISRHANREGEKERAENHVFTGTTGKDQTATSFH